MQNYKYKIFKTSIQNKHCKSAKPPWHQNINLSFWSLSFLLLDFLSFQLFVFFICFFFNFLSCWLFAFLILCLFDLLTFCSFDFMSFWFLSFQLFIFFIFCLFVTPPTPHYHHDHYQYDHHNFQGHLDHHNLQGVRRRVGVCRGVKGEEISGSHCGGRTPHQVIFDIIFVSSSGHFYRQYHHYHYQSLTLVSSSLSLSITVGAEPHIRSSLTLYLCHHQVIFIVIISHCGGRTPHQVIFDFGVIISIIISVIIIIIISHCGGWTPHQVIFMIPSIIVGVITIVTLNLQSSISYS